MRINKTYSYNLLILFLLVSSVFALPSTAVFSAAGDPAITIDSPADNELLNQKTVVISGTYSDTNVTQSTDLTFTAIDETNFDITNQGTWDVSNPDNGNGTWKFTIPFDHEGNHVINIKFQDQTSAFSNEPSVTFNIDTKRPHIFGTPTILEGSNEFSAEDLTNVPLDAKIKLTIADDQPMENLKTKINDTNNPYNPIKVIAGSKLDETADTLGGTTVIDYKGNQAGEYQYDITFTPSDLKISKNYLVYLDPGLLDDSNGPVYMKFFKFTTKTNADWDDPYDSTPDPEGHDSSNPHGHFMLNTNMCAACHSTHVNSPYDKNINSNSKLDPAREGGSYLMTFKSAFTKDNGEPDLSQNYCTACHDGTLNAPNVDGIKEQYHHDNPSDYDQANGTNNLKEATSCTSCHNPHLEWSKDNPNLLQDHYVYTHNEDIKDQNGDEIKDQNGDPIKVIDSFDTSCETCHEDDTAYNVDSQKNVSIFDKTTFPNGNYSPYFYKKSMTASSEITPKQITDTDHPNTIQDYSLCLRCHNDKKKNGATDIETFYTKSNGHFLALPDGATKQVDGSPLNGPMPCAECHDTHGSNNIKMLKSQLGQENPQDFSATLGEWDIGKEKLFCKSCHYDNGTTTINGVTAQPLDTTNHNSSTDSKACSECHTNSYDPNDPASFSKAFMEAAHGPTKGIVK